MLHDTISIVALLTLIAGACQWIAWRFRLPALVLLSLCGVILGPATGWLNPLEYFGGNLSPLVSLAVAVILFEGGLNLRLTELHSTKLATFGMILVGAPLGWFLIASALHSIAGFSGPVSAVLGGLLVVTGPTVIIPMLRQARLNPRVASVLKWEGIVNDPIGALFATVTYEYFASDVVRHAPGTAIAVLAFHIFVVSLQSYLIGVGISFAFRKSHVPEFLKPIVILTAVLAAYALGNRIQSEGGLIAVTVLGMTLANVPFPAFEEQRRFKEYLTTLLVSLVFIILTAALQPENLLKLHKGMLVFILVLMFVIRPLTVWVSTIKSGLSWKERLFIGWIAPRGVVCVVVAGLFGPKMVALGYPDARLLTPLVFAVVFATVIVHGFTIRPLAKKLGLVPEGKQGLIIIGATPWTAAFAEALKRQDVPVLVIDNNWHRLSPLRQAQVPTLYGEPLSSAFENQMDMSKYTYLLCATDNTAYNALVCSHFSYEYGRGNILQLAGEKDENELWAYHESVKGLTLIGESQSFSDLQSRLYIGWKFTATRLTDKYTFQDFAANLNREFFLILAVTESGALRFSTVEHMLVPKTGDTVIAFTAPEKAPVEMPGEEVFDTVTS